MCMNPWTTQSGGELILSSVHLWVLNLSITDLVKVFQSSLRERRIYARSLMSSRVLEKS